MSGCTRNTYFKFSFTGLCSRIRDSILVLSVCKRERSSSPTPAHHPCCRLACETWSTTLEVRSLDFVVGRSFFLLPCDGCEILDCLVYEDLIYRFRKVRFLNFVVALLRVSFTADVNTIYEAVVVRSAKISERFSNRVFSEPAPERHH